MLRRRMALSALLAFPLAMGWGAPGPKLRVTGGTSLTSNASRSERSKPTKPGDVVSIENQTMRVSFDARSGALRGLESKLTGWRIQDGPALESHSG